MGDVPTTQPPIRVSIVVAGIADPLESGEIPGFAEIVKQAGALAGEVLCVAPTPGGSQGSIRMTRLVGGEPETLEVSSSVEGDLTPHLWQAGIEAARGEIVVLTLAGLVPGPQWLAEHLAVHSSGDYAAVGGPIDPEPDAGKIDRAVSISRYSDIMTPFEDHEVHDLAADNASYNLEALRSVRDSYAHGFWEPFVHARLTAGGKKLQLSARPLMHHARTYGFWGFIRQRLVHGFHFGVDRKAGATASWLVKYLILSPGLPLLLTLRVVSRLRSRGYGLGAALAVVPELLCFNLAWALGEISGTLAPGRPSTTESAEEAAS